MWIHKIAALIHGADAVGVTIGSQAEIPEVGANSSCQRAQEAGDRFGVNAAKTGVHFTADLANLAAGSLQDAFNNTAPRAVHGVNHNALGAFGYLVKIY